MKYSISDQLFSSTLKPGRMTCVWYALHALLLFGPVGCSSDPMEACMRHGLEQKLAPESADRGAYIKARELVRLECEKKLK